MEFLNFLKIIRHKDRIVYIMDFDTLEEFGPNFPYYDVIKHFVQYSENHYINYSYICFYEHDNDLKYTLLSDEEDIEKQFKNYKKIYI